ncbi:unnamed protein product, partial [Adineta steineri]
TQQQTQSSPEESIFLICERERGVSLPVTMNIDYDDITFRLSTSTPNEAQLCSTRQTHLLARLSTKTESSCRASSPSLNSYDNDQQKRSSWLNNLNTFTTTTDDTNERMLLYEKYFLLDLIEFVVAFDLIFHLIPTVVVVCI